MNIDQALAECVEGVRISADHMQPGCYVEHTFSRGFVRCWPVASAALEPGRTQCDFIAKDDDRAAMWRVVANQYAKPKLDPRKGGW